MNVNGVPHRTIWPAKENPAIVRIIDQRHLPHRFVVEELKNLDDFCRAIGEMHVRGAGLIGATAGFGMYSAMLRAPKTGTGEYIENAAAKLIATRPTATNLSWAVNRQKSALLAEIDYHSRVEKAFQIATEIADEDADFCRRIGDHGVSIIKEISLLKKGDTVHILTHCNAGWLAFVDYGSATAPLYAAHRQGIKIHVWVDETRPWLQGAKLTAWELAQENIPHTLIPDNTGGHLMQHGMVDMVIVGTDRTTRTGDVANKIGTYLKALAAKDNDIPFYVALPSSTFDWKLRDGLKEIPIEERSAREVLYIEGQTAAGLGETVLVAPEKTVAANYGFDVTPARLVTALITERGVMAANERDILRFYPEQETSSGP